MSPVRSRAKANPDPPPKWLTVEEITEYWPITRRSLERMIADGLLPKYRIPGHRHRYFKEADVDALFELDNGSE
jgi:excisionase family DNA binding protein